MKPQDPALYNESETLVTDPKEVEQSSEDDLWFLPGPMDEEPDYMPPGPRAETRETAVLDDWRHRLVLIEAADLSWFVGDRIGPERLALWISLRLSGVQDDTAALARVGSAVRRLTGGSGPEVDLSACLDRWDPGNPGDDDEPFADRAGGWLDLMAQASDVHPITRACMGFHLCSLAGLGQQGDRIEAAVTASRIAASKSKGAIFVPLAMGGAGGLRAGGPPKERLARWLDGMSTACLTAMRQLDDIEAWAA